MSKSNSAGERKNKSNTKHKSYSKSSMDENILAFVNNGHSLKPCYVSLTRINAETYLANLKNNSHVLKQTMGISFTMNDKIHSKSLKNNCLILEEFQKNTEVPRESFHSKGSVKNIHNSSASCSFVTVHNDTVIKPCYVKLERINTAVKRPYLDFPENISPIKRFKLCKSNTCRNYENISSSSKYLIHEEHLSQPRDAGVGWTSNESQEGSSDMILLKTCTVQLSTFIDVESVSNMDHPVFRPGSCKMQNTLVNAEDSMSGSFVSESLLSSPSSLGDHEVNKRTEKLDALILPCCSPNSDANEKVEEANVSQNSLSKPTHVRSLFSDSSSSEFDVNVEKRVSDDNENSVEQNTSLLPSAACSLEFDAEKNISDMDYDVLKCSTKQKVKLSSSCSSECSTVRNTSKYPTKNHRRAFSQRANRRRNNPSKRDFSNLPSFDCSSDSSSTVVNCRIAKFNSYKQGLMKRNVESLRTSSVISSRTTTNGNAADKIHPLKCKQSQKSYRTNTKTGESSAHNCESSHSSETEENFSDNYFHKLNNDAYAGNLELKQSKYSSNRRKHFVFNGTQSSIELNYKAQLISSDEWAECNLLEIKSSNSDTKRKCKVLPKYNLKPCYVTLNRMEINDSFTKISREKSSNLHENDPLKPVSLVECVEQNCSKQIKSFKNTSKIYKSMNNIQRERSFCENNYSVSVEECRVRKDSESEKDFAKHCTDCYTNKNSVDQLQDDCATNKNPVDQLQDSSDESDHQALTSKQFSKHKHFSDDSSSLPDVDSIIDSSKHLKESVCRKVSSETNDLNTESHHRILNNHEAGVVTEVNDENLVATDIYNVSNRRRSAVQSENNFKEREHFYNLDYDDAYLADTDDCSESDFVENYNSNHISQDNNETSVGLRVNLSGSKNVDKSIQRQIPYCCLGSKNVVGKHFDNIYLFKSKTNGNVYIVDIFEFENIKKMFVTIKLKNTNLNDNTLFEKRNFPTLSERMNALGCFDEENARIYRRNPFIFTNIDSGQHESDVNYLEKQNSSPESTNHVIGKDTLLSATGNSSESSGDTCTEPKPSCSQSPEFKDLTNSNTSSDSSDSAGDKKINDHCVHCCEKFSTRKDDFNHTCQGKLQKGFLCIYCEKIFSSYSKLQSHKQLHFI